MSNINWDFISQQEGGGKKRGYIPKHEGEVLDSSGVTIATGWDVGQMSKEELTRSGLSQNIINKMIDYVGKTGKDSLYALDKFGIPEIEDKEVIEINKYTKNKTLSSIRKKYEKDSGESFDILTKAQQTVLASVAFQYGSNLKSKTPNFWKQVTSGDWDSVVKNLENFGDKYSSRRNREANLLKNESISNAAVKASKDGVDIAMNEMQKINNEGEIKEQISFKDAFKKARSSLGEGKEFEWEGKMYSTNIAKEDKKG